jgi:acetoin utilization deacetylase AcuC-like enzyme
VKHRVYYNADYVASAYAFDTTRKSGALADVLRNKSKVSIVDPSPFTSHTKAIIDRVHDRPYVTAVAKGAPLGLAESQGFAWDPKLPTMAIAHSAGLVAAVTDVMTTTTRVSGSLSSGLHHAKAGRGSGFCTFNGLVVGATEALDRGAERILVLDFDAHCGGGTRSMTSPERIVQIDVSTVGFDTWVPTGNDSLVMAEHDNYLVNIRQALDVADAAGTFDLVLYNAGMDPIDSGVSSADLALREQMVAEWAVRRDQRLVYALAGGYTGGGIDMDDLVGLHRLTVDAFSQS